MFVGNTGTGKTANIMSKLNRMDPEATMYTTINMNSFSDAPSLQVMMEQPLEKKSGVRYGPPSSRRCACAVTVPTTSLSLGSNSSVCTSLTSGQLADGWTADPPERSGRKRVTCRHFLMTAVCV
jgi:hypothetical protein